MGRPAALIPYGLLPVGVLGCWVAGQRPSSRNLAQPPAPRTIISWTQRTFLAYTLGGFVRSSDVVAVGRVGSKPIRQARTPIDGSLSTTGARCHTVYPFVVERYLWGAGPQNLKVYQTGGTVGGITYIDSENPMLTLGERYILFLKSRSSPVSRHYGFVPYVKDGRLFHDGYPDEFIFTDVLRGKILIRGGRTRVPDDPLQPNLQAWQFQSRHSEQIIGQTEAEAIAAIIRSAQRAGSP